MQSLPDAVITLILNYIVLDSFNSARSITHYIYCSRHAFTCETSLPVHACLSVGFVCDCLVQWLQCLFLASPREK